MEEEKPLEEEKVKGDFAHAFRRNLIDPSSLHRHLQEITEEQKDYCYSHEVI